MMQLTATSFFQSVDEFSISVRNQHETEDFGILDSGIKIIDFVRNGQILLL